MPRPSTRVLVFGAAAAFVVLAIILLSTSPAARTAREVEERRAAAQAEGTTPKAVPSVTVDATTVSPVSAKTTVDVAGVLNPVREVVIGAEIGGRVIAIDAEEHTPVEQGEILVRLDPALPEAAVEQARASLLRAEASARLARSEVARQRELSRQGVASASELDRAESQDQTSDAEVAQARAALNDAETRLAKTEIRAPFGGVVSALDLEPGAYLAPGMAVAELADLGEVEIEVGLSDQEILAVSDRMPVRVSVEALPGRWFEGRVVNPGRTADAQTRKYPVAVRVPNPDGTLLPGMLGTVRFELGDARPVLRIPRRSVSREFELEYLYVLEPADGGDTARQRRVKTRPVAFQPELLEITDGVEAGERIATSGVAALRDGQLVRVRQSASTAARPAEDPAS